jgi:hypothetical protein
MSRQVERLNMEKSLMNLHRLSAWVFKQDDSRIIEIPGTSITIDLDKLPIKESTDEEVSSDDDEIILETPIHGDDAIDE